MYSAWVGADRSLAIGSSIHRLHSRLFKQPSALPQMERPIGTFDRDGDVRGTDSIYGSWPAGNGVSGKRWNSEGPQFWLQASEKLGSGSFVQKIVRSSPGKYHARGHLYFLLAR